MDRRKRKTREAILCAFTDLLSEKNITRITVEDIITRADIGRATFYAHFETKDFLWKELCEELFCHIFDAMKHNPENHQHIFSCEAPDSAFLHLFQHFEKNDHQILSLLSCSDNELFLSCFREGLKKLLQAQPAYKTYANTIIKLPEDLRINYITAVLIETLKWWITEQPNLSAETVTEYFLSFLQPSEIL